MAESIYKVSRRLKRTEQTVYNALRSIYEDSLFVLEIRHLWSDVPLLANLRCGLWYARKFDGTCYFKSTDGHNGNWSFSTVRLNLHVATLAAERGGCCIADATRKGKRFPDSMSKTLPIWACVLNRALADFRPPRTQEETQRSSMSETPKQTEEFISCKDLQKETSFTEDWDCTLHLPLWISNVEKANIERRIDGWVESLKSTGADLAALAKVLKKPLRPLWISQKTVIWLNEVPDLEDWNFTPIILVSASRPSAFTQRFTDGEFSWSYIPGAADDEESWARGLTPDLFWRNSSEIISGGPSSCNGIVADIVEKDRVYKAVRGLHAPQVRAKAGFQEKIKLGEAVSSSFVNDGPEIHGHPSSAIRSASNEDETVTPSQRIISLEIKQIEGENEDTGDPFVKWSRGRKSFPVLERELANMHGFHWIGNTGLAVGNADCANMDSIHDVVDGIIDCGTSSSSSSSSQTESCLYLPIVGPKFDRYSLQNHLAKAVAFAREKLISGSTVFIYCSNGEDISVCVCLAVLLSCFNPHGQLEDTLTTDKVITKSDVRERLIYLSSFNTDARPSRGSLRQVFNFFNPIEDFLTGT